MTDRPPAPCPHCGTRLSRPPLRKAACPHCGGTIRVRRGALVADPAGPAAATALAALAPAAEPSGTLEEDLRRYATEFYTTGDLEAGRQLLCEVAGMAAAGGLLLTALTSWLPGIGIAVGSGTVLLVMTKAAEAYAEMDADGRRRIRAAVCWVRGGFSLDRLVDE